MVKSGGDSWFFITADYAFGHALERDTAAVVKANGGKVLGSVKVPLNNADFSSFLLQAQASKAKIIGLANAGGDTINTIKQAAEFGIVAGGQKLAGLLVFITDVHSLGLKTAQGLQLTEAFYWDQDDETRAWSKQFFDKMKQAADDGAGRRLYRRHCTTSKAVKATDSARRADAVDQEAEVEADQRLRDQERQDPGGRHAGARHVPVRGQEAGASRRANGISTSWSARSPARRPTSAPAATNARW